MFVTLEGIEGTGKSTQLRRIRKHLEGAGREVLTTLEPGGSRLGLELRRILLDMQSRDLTSSAELFLYLADRAQHVASVVRPALAAGQVVLCDRFADSTVAYQGYGRGLDPQLLHTLNSVAVGDNWPELTILLDIDPQQGLRRALARNLEQDLCQTEGRFEAESIDFHTRVREGYLTLAALHPERIRVVDAAPDADVVFADVAAHIDAALARATP